VVIKFKVVIAENLLRVNVGQFQSIVRIGTLGTLETQRTLNMSKLELIEELKQIDEVTLLELLQIDTQDLIDAFLDKIDENQSKLIKHLNEF
jgi:hypothetical protein